MLPISAVAQRYLKMMEAASAAPVKVKEIVVQDEADETVTWNQRDGDERTQFLLGNSCAPTDFAFATENVASNSLADSTEGGVFNRNSEQDRNPDNKFAIFSILKAGPSQEFQRPVVMATNEGNPVAADATYTVIRETSTFDQSTDTAALFNSTAREKTNPYFAAAESASDSEEELFEINASGLPDFTFARDTSDQVSHDESSMNFSRSSNLQWQPHAVKRRRIAPINFNIWNEASDESKTNTEALFATQAAVTLGNQTSQTKIECITIDESVSRVCSALSESCCVSSKAEPEDAFMSEGEAAIEDFGFDVPTRVREKFYEKCYKQKKKVHFNTYFQSPKVVKPEQPAVTDFCFPENEEDFEDKAKEFMMTFFYANEDGLDSVGDPNTSFTFGNDDDDDIRDMDIEDEESFMEQRLFSSTPTKKKPESSFSASRSFKPVVVNTKLPLEVAKEIEKAEEKAQPNQMSCTPPTTLSEDEKREKRLSLSDRKSPPKNKTISQSVRLEVSQKPSTMEENLHRAARKLSFNQSAHASLAPAEAEVEDDDVTRDDVESLVNCVVEKAAPVVDVQNESRCFARLSESSQPTPKSEIPQQLPSSQLEDYEMLSVPEEYLNPTAKRLGSDQLKHTSPTRGEGNDMTPDEVEKFLENYAMEKAALVKDSKNNFRGFTKQQRVSVQHLDQEVVKEILNSLIEDDTQTNEKSVEVLQKIEKVFILLLEAMSEGRPMALKVPTVRKWKDCTMSQDILTKRDSTPVKTISHGNKQSERTFAVNVTVLCEVYKMLARNTTCTKRELYYRDVDMFQNQGSVNIAIDSICAMLGVQEFELGVLTSSKGLVVGDLIIKIGDDITNCTNQCSVPQNPSAITSLESTADYVLVVEKDTVFQRLVSEKIFSRIDAKLILVTAKGYPDVNTRVLLKKIADDLKLPIYILVDADPHGLEIMMTYKFGSMLKIHNSQHLAVTSIQWIGVYPSDLVREDAMTMDLTEKDLKKIDELLERPYIDALLKRELNCFKKSQKKAEIESLYSFSINNLINDYIPRKIRSLETRFTQL